MKNALSETAIVRTVANQAAERVALRVIAALQKRTETSSGHDSELKTVWDEICVQIQYEQSILWDAYEATVRPFVEPYVEELPRHEREALWLQTPEGMVWDCEPAERREADPVVSEHVVDFLIQEYIYAKAGGWSNARIRAFLGRSSRRD